MSELRQVAFPPEVLARISPETSLQRHLSIGLRPNLRNFNEFKSISISQGNLNKHENVAGSSILKAGKVTVICTITLGIVEESRNDDLLSTSQQDEYCSVYPVVEIARGRSGAPTDEEMILSQRLYETTLHSKLIPSSSLKIVHGVSVVDEDGKINIFYPDRNPEEFELLNINRSKKYSFVLYANLKVFSRSGPLFDLCYLALTNALKSVQLPRVYEKDYDSIKIPLNSRNRFANSKKNQNTFNADLDDELKYHLNLNDSEFGISSNFGVIELEQPTNINEDDIPIDDKTILLSDLEGQCEENSITSKIDIVSTDMHLKSISLVGGGSAISLETLKEAIDISKLRAKNFVTTNTIINNE